MKIKKSLIGIVVFLILVALLGFGGFYLKNDAENVWNNESSWKRDSVISYDKTVKEVRSSETNGEKKVVIPYCILYDIKQVDDVYEYYCSQQPWYITGLVNTNIPGAKFSSDVILRRSKGTILPESFLDVEEVTEDTIKSFGNSPVLSDLVVTYTEAVKEKSLTNVVNHYWQYRVQHKQEVISQQLTSWSMNKYETTSTPSKESLTTWVNWAWGSIKNHISYKYLMPKTGNEFLTMLGMGLSESVDFCYPNESNCKSGYLSNPAANIMYLLYTANLNNDPLADKFLTIAREKMSPYYEIATKKNFVTYVSECTKNKKCPADYQDMQVYDFPVCPTREMYTGSYKGKNIELFKEYMQAYAGKSYSDATPVKSKQEILTALSDLAAESTRNRGSYELLAQKDVLSMNEVCYGMIMYNLNSANDIAQLKKAYINLLAQSYGIIQENGTFKKLETYDDLMLMMNRSWYQASPMPFVAHEGIAYDDFMRNTGMRDDMLKNRMFAASLPMTLYLIYMNK